MTSNERFRQLTIQHSDCLDQIQKEWQRADETMLEFQIAGMGRETGGYEKIAAHERGMACRLVTDYHDKVVMPLLPHVDELLQRELIAFADRLYDDIQDPRKPWSPRYRDKKLKLDRLLGARSQAQETAEIAEIRQAAQQRVAQDPATLPHPHVGDDLLQFLQDQPDERSAVVDLPEYYHDANMLTVCDADGLIEFGRRNHYFVGPIEERDLHIEPGWDFGSVSVERRVPMARLLAEALNRTDDERIRSHVRLTAKGRTYRARVTTEHAPSMAKLKRRTTETDWRDIGRRLERSCVRGEEYTTQAKLGEKLGCSPSTINKAIRHSTKLNAWKAEATARRGKQAPHASSLTEVHLDSTAQTREENPADVLSDEDIDRAMRRLIEEAEPEEKARLNELSEDEQRKLVQVFYEQGRDQEPSPLEDDRPGKRSIKVREHKRL